MEPARLRLALPDDTALLERLAAALAEQGEPSITVARDSTVVTFESATAEFMIRSRVFQALEDVVGEGWPALIAPVS